MGQGSQVRGQESVIKGHDQGSLVRVHWSWVTGQRSVVKGHDQGSKGLEALASSSG